MRDLQPLEVDFLVAVEQDVQIDVPWALVYQLLPAQRPLDVLELVEETQGLQLGFDLASRVGGRNGKDGGRQRTSHAPLTKLSCSSTYMGSVSHRLLVRFTRMPRASISLQALSIQPMRSPRLLPRAM